MSRSRGDAGRIDRRRSRARRDGKRGAGDTLAWLWAAFQIIAPVLLVLIVVVLLAYGLIHVLFLR